MDITFTSATRDSLTAAQENARQRRSAAITPTDLLIGVASTPGPGRAALHAHGATASTLRTNQDEPRTLTSSTHEPQPDAGTTRALENALVLATAARANAVDTHHVLEALLDDADVTRLLERANATPDHIRNTLTSGAPAPESAAEAPTATSGGVLDIIFDILGDGGFDLS